MKKYYIVIIILLIVACKNNVTNSKKDYPNQNILYYGFDQTYSDSISIRTINLAGMSNNEVYKGYKKYPTWYEYPNKIIVCSKNYDTETNELKYSLELLDIQDNSNNYEVLVENIGNILFLRYSINYNAVLFSYRNIHGISQIAYYDLSSDEKKTLFTNNNDARNPIWSEKDNWIYFTGKVNSTLDLYRITKDGENYQSFIIDNDFDISTFDISSTSDLLVASRYNNNSSFITVYSLLNKSILYNIDMSDYGMALYPSFTSDNNKILFVNGVANNYSVPRNIHIMNIDGSNKQQLTFDEENILSRPLNW